MKKVVLALTLLLSSCASGGSTTTSLSTSSGTSSNYSIDNVSTYVYGNLYDYEGFGEVYITEHGYTNPTPNDYSNYSFEYEGNNIRIDDGLIIGLKGNTTTRVRVTNPLGEVASFDVEVRNRTYSSQHEEAETSEGWFDEVSVDPVTNIASIRNGMDISSAYLTYLKTSRYRGAYYNEDGDEQSLFYLLKEAGIDSIRLRLWNDPYNYNLLDEDGNPTPYGAGICDYNALVWMAREAKHAGLDYMLDFHYSDWYCDPGVQVLPKAWANITSYVELGNTLYTYTRDTLKSLKELDLLPSSVQIGNEISSGMFRHYPGEDHNALTGDNPYYSSRRSDVPDTLAGYGELQAYYLGRAARGVKAVDENIDVVIHSAREFYRSSNIINWYNQFDEVEYDVIGMSSYPYWQFDESDSSLSLKDLLTPISNAFPDKKIALVETGYAFTNEYDTQLGSYFNSSMIQSKFEVSLQGQADVIRYVSDALASLPNGYGVYYWEGAWKITNGVGWADSNSKNSWANQALFSYQGKALGSLATYNQMKGE